MVDVFLFWIFIVCFSNANCQELLELEFDQRVGKHRQVIFPHFPGKCEILDGSPLYGSEDMATTSDGMAFVSSKPFPPPSIPIHNGAIYMFDTNDPAAGVAKVSITNRTSSIPFQPLGLSILQTDSDVLLFVINFAKSPKIVEKFRFDPETKMLHYLKTYRDPAMQNMNNIVAVGPDQFYFTNSRSTLYNSFALDVTYNPGLWNTVGFYYGEGAKVVADGFYANGIAMSRDEEYIYVSNMFRRSLMIYKRAKDNVLTLTQEFFADLIPDNIHVDKKGNLWMCFFPHSLEQLKGTPGHKMQLPTVVLKIKVLEGRVEDVNEVLADTGDVIKGRKGSIAVPDSKEKNLFLGTVSGKVYHCRLKAF